MTDNALVGLVAGLFDEFDIDPTKPVHPQINALSERRQAFDRRWRDLPGTVAERRQAILTVRSNVRQPYASLRVPQRQQRLVLTNAAGKPVRISGEPGERYAIQVTAVGMTAGVLTLTAVVTEGRTEEIE